MRRTRLALGLLALPALGLSAGLAAPVRPGPARGVVKDADRDSFIPKNKYKPVPGKAIGLLVSDVRDYMAHEGRGGPADAMGFSSDGTSYRWVYVPVTERALITNFTVRAGPKGDQKRTYPSLSLASPTTVRSWGITAPYALVEVEVNDGLGAPPDLTFVGTRMKRLDASRDYPLKVPEVLADLKKKYARHVKDGQKKVDDALAEVQNKVLKGRKVTGPRQTAELVYMTWLPKEQHLQVRFRTRLTDGAYQYTEGRRGPFALPPGKGGPRRPPPPRRPLRVRYGVEFGVEHGMGYEVDKAGKLVQTLELPIKTFSREIPPPPGVRGK
jgi:hypothetical protein